MATADTLLAAALAAGADKLSPHECWLLIAYNQSGANSAQTQIDAAIAAGFDRLAFLDGLQALAYATGGGGSAQNNFNAAIKTNQLDQLSQTDALRVLAAENGGNLVTTLKSAITVGGFDRLTDRDAQIVALYGTGVAYATMEANMAATGCSKLGWRDAVICFIYGLIVL